MNNLLLIFMLYLIPGLFSIINPQVVVLGGKAYM